MNQQSFNNLEKAISTSRLSSYKNSSNYLNGICEIPKNNKELLANYILNAKLSENFYFLLQNLEVCLRNTIYDSFNTKFSDKDFFNLVNPNTKNTSNFNKRYNESKNIILKKEEIKKELDNFNITSY